MSSVSRASRSVRSGGASISEGGGCGGRISLMCFWGKGGSGYNAVRKGGLHIADRSHNPYSSSRPGYTVSASAIGVLAPAACYPRA